jgi:excisionase family DNA binding protein
MNNKLSDPNTSLMTINDVSQYLRISKANVYELAKHGRLPSFRIGKLWRFKKEIIDEWIKHETIQKPAP